MCAKRGGNDDWQNVSRSLPFAKINKSAWESWLNQGAFVAAR
jgi:hypothetical protein